MYSAHAPRFGRRKPKVQIGNTFGLRATEEAYLLKRSGTTDHAGSCKPQGLMMAELVLGEENLKFRLARSGTTDHAGSCRKFHP